MNEDVKIIIEYAIGAGLGALIFAGAGLAVAGFRRPNELIQWWRHLRRPPVVVISRSGQATDRPQIHVSVAGIGASQSVYTWDATDQGEACATMYGRGLADIMRRQLIDQREKKE